MALNIFTGSTTANWSATSSWTLGRIPTSSDGDTAYFGPTSPTCSVDIPSTPCYNFDCSTYTRQLNLLQNIFIYGTYSNFGGGIFRFTAASGLPGSTITFMGTCSITSNGYVFKREGGSINGGVLRFGYNGTTDTTITFLDQFEATNITVSPQSGNPFTALNGATISARESFTTTTNANMPGSANIQIKATSSNTTSTLSIFSSNPISNSVYINSPGIVNISTLSMRSNNNVFKYISGSLSITSFIIYPNNSTLTYDNSANTLINTTTFNVSSNNNMTFSSVYPLNTTTLTMNGGGGSTTTNYFIYGGFSCSTFTSTNGNSNTNLTIWLSPTSSYYINNTFNSNSYTSLTRTEFKSTSATLTPLIVNYNATQTIFDTYFTNIDASAGATILPYLKFATLSNTTNIRDLKSWYIQTNQIQLN